MSTSMDLDPRDSLIAEDIGSPVAPLFTSEKSNGVPTGSVKSFNPKILQPPSNTGTPEISEAMQQHLNIALASEDDISEDYDAESDVKSEIDVEDYPFHGLPINSLPTGLCYDPRMRYHSELNPQSELHPEDPRRIYYIYKELCLAGLVDDPIAQKPLVDRPLARILARPATEDEICLVHEKAHFNFVRETATKSDEVLQYFEREMDSIYFNRLSFESGLLAAGGAIETCRDVAERKYKNAIAVIRPPGHHAEVHCAMGFCLFNNVCVAARVCQNALGESCRRILILDWDVHHGNGVQKAFYDDPNILYISIHVYEDGRFYPGSEHGNHEHCGEGPGLGKNVNIPWPTKGMGDGDYIYAFQQVVMPIAYEFDPQLVIISAGFDAAAGDELGGCFVTPPCYAHMTHMLMSLAQGKVAVCLEGGYNFRSISKSALAVTRTLMGEPPDRLRPTRPTESCVDIVKDVVRIQSRHWNSMHPRDLTDGLPHTERMDEVIRAFQAQHLQDQYRLNVLYIFRDKINRIFKNQVLATPDFDEKENLVVIFHDPPDVMGIPSPSTGKLELHRTWLADELKGYNQWFIDNGFGVIDVNIPLSVRESGESSDAAFQARRELMERLAMYLWENYIDTSDCEHIILFGIGEAYHGLAQLLIQNVDVYQRVDAVIVFTFTNSLRSVTSPDNQWLPKWYRDHSLVFVSSTHDAWNRGEKKLSKRYGSLRKSEGRSMQHMLRLNRKEVQDYVGRVVGLQVGKGKGDTTEEEDGEDGVGRIGRGIGGEVRMEDVGV
ncbi:MAG: hypothetical protein Q9227_007657 [Pyrenula ochraceoflavens]